MLIQLQRSRHKQLPDGKSIFFGATLADLAAAEKRHYKTIQSIQSQTSPFSDPAIPLNGLQNVFAAGDKFVGDKETLIAELKAEQIDLYRAALVKGKESVALYQKLYE